MGLGLCHGEDPLAVVDDEAADEVDGLSLVVKVAMTFSGFLGLFPLELDIFLRLIGNEEVFK